MEKRNLTIILALLIAKTYGKSKSFYSSFLKKYVGCKTL
jgi:plasmid maintenance system antidote protein VapI